MIHAQTAEARTDGVNRRAESDALDHLEAEAVFVMREVAGQCRRPVLLFSGGKDSVCLLRIAEKAFRPGRFPFALLHVDTGHNHPEVLEFRDRRAAELGERLIVRSVEDSARRGTVRFESEDAPRNAHQSVTLVEAIEELEIDACIGGARRDEEKARAKERIFSFRDRFGGWDPKRQRPEPFDLFHAKVAPGENVRVFPISNWTEIDVWRYVQREGLELPSLYYAHERDVVSRKGALVPVTAVTPPRPGETVERQRVRFRTVGDMTCTAAVRSDATTIEQVIDELLESRTSERGATRLDDRGSDDAMERRKREGYF